MALGLDAVSWSAVVGSALLAAAVSPLLAGWTAALADGQVAGWWRPRRVSGRRGTTVAAVAIMLGALAAAGRPWPAWWLFAVGGAVLAVVDVEVQLLPSRLVYPLAGLELVAFVAAAVTDSGLDRSIRAMIAAAVIGAGWFVLAFIAGGGIGLGDVRVAAMSGMLLGWAGWPQVLRGQLLVVVLAIATAVCLALLRPDERGRTMRIPLGPSLIGATVIMCWS